MSEHINDVKRALLNDLIGTPETRYSLTMRALLNVAYKLDSIKFENNNGSIEGYSLKSIFDFREWLLTEAKTEQLLHLSEVQRSTPEILKED